MKDDITTGIELTLELRIIYSLLLCSCALLIFYIRSFLKRRWLKQRLFIVAVWLICLGSARGIATLIDYYFGAGLGFLPLVINNICWCMPIWKLGQWSLMLYRLKKNQTLLHTTIERVEISFDEVATLLRANTDATNRVAKALSKMIF